MLKWERVNAAVNDVGHEDRAVADIQKKWSDLKLLGGKEEQSYIYNSLFSTQNQTLKIITVGLLTLLIDN